MGSNQEMDTRYATVADGRILKSARYADHGKVEAPQQGADARLASIEEIKRQCKDLRGRATNARVAKELLPQAIELAEQFPDLLETQLTRAHLREATRVGSGMLEEWQSLYQRFPECDTALRLLVRWLNRSQRTDDAQRLIVRHFGNAPEAYADRLATADLFNEIHDFERSDGLFESLIDDFPEKPAARVRFAKRLMSRGSLLDAHRILSPTADALSGEGALLFGRIDGAVTALSEVAPLGEVSGTEIGTIALREAILQFRDRHIAPAVPDRLGGVTLITGTLGAGGAERQLTRIAAMLEQTRREGVSIDGIELDGPVEVVIKSMTSKKGDDFFLPFLEKADVTVHQMLDMDAVRLEEIDFENAQLRALYPVLPRIAIFGIQRLVRYFRERETECAFIWQDGAVLVAALAALIAGVPRIVVNVRGLPPSIRRDLHSPEYEEMYRALAKVPNVQFVSNNSATVDAYCQWVGLASERFEVVLNGVPRQPSDAPRIETSLWEEFAARTPDATETIGGVFRFDRNKRPLLWVDFAKRYLERQPKARFVIVGTGDMHDLVRDRVQRLGISDRFLLTGRSQHVGYWLEKIDILCLLSRYEGLPNVLIEAQMAGVPVVSTPAGGACETFLDGETGFALSCAKKPDLDELCGLVANLIDDKARYRNMQETARQWASNQFSIEKMLARTVSTLTGPRHGSMMASGTEVCRQT